MAQASNDLLSFRAKALADAELVKVSTISELQPNLVNFTCQSLLAFLTT
jgi:hypothetical protein